MITKDDVLKMTVNDVPTLLAAVKAPETAAALQEILRDRTVIPHVSTILQEHKQLQAQREVEQERQSKLMNPPSTEEMAAEAAEIAQTPDPSVPVPAVAPAPVVAATDTAVEDAAWKAEGVTVSRDAAGKITRMHQEYQVRDEEGNAIGRPTSLIAASPQELSQKQRVAHENATRAFNRLKKQKVTFKQEPKTVLTADELSAAVSEVLAAKDAAKAEDVIVAAYDTHYQKREQAVRNREQAASNAEIVNRFMANHLADYYPCDANLKALGEYFNSKGLEFTLDNLETAFEDLMSEDKLVKVKTFQIPAESVANTTATATTTQEAPVGTPPASQPVAVTITEAQPVAESKPVVEATVTTPVAANQPTAARRPGVNGGLVPGSMSAHRPVPTDTAPSRTEFMQKIKKMSTEEFKRFKANPQNVKTAATFGIKL